MKSKFVRVLLAIAVTLTFSALAQTGSAATPSSAAAAPATTPAGSAPATTTGPTGATKVGTINIQEAIFGSNEGQKEIQALQNKFEPKQAELKSQNDELESLKKQLNTQGDKLNEDAAGNLKKQIETKQKSFDRNVQDAQEEFGSQQQDIASKILQKMAPMIVKYSRNSHVNVGSGQDLTILELTKLVCDVVGIVGKITFDRSKPDGMPQKLMSPEQMKSLGWAPRISVGEGLETTYRWYLTNRFEHVVETALN